MEEAYFNFSQYSPPLSSLNVRLKYMIKEFWNGAERSSHLSVVHELNVASNWEGSGPVGGGGSWGPHSRPLPLLSTCGKSSSLASFMNNYACRFRIQPNSSCFRFSCECCWIPNEIQLSRNLKVFLRWMLSLAHCSWGFYPQGKVARFSNFQIGRC